MKLDSGIFDVTINVAPGTYDEAVKVDGRMLGSGTLVIEGDVTDPTQVSLQRLTCENGAVLTVRGFDFTAGNGVQAFSAAQLGLGAAQFSGTGSAMQIRQATVDCNYATLSFGNGITTIATMYNYAYLSALDATFDIATGTDWGASGAFFASGFCLVWLQSAQFTGDAAAAVGRRYSISLMSAINTNGQPDDFIPGDAAGKISSGSIYQ